MNGSPTENSEGSAFYGAGYFEYSPVSDWNQRYIIPKYACPVCGNEKQSHVYSYPHLDPADALTAEELKSLGPRVRSPTTNEGMIRIVEKLRRQWGIPVTTGTQFGPSKLKITSKPKVDFYVLIFHAGLFCRRAAAERLLTAGVQFDHVKTDAWGKYAEEADFLELVVPVKGHSALPEGRPFCQSCFRYPGGTFETVLIEEKWMRRQAFFRVIETGAIVFSSQFITTVNRLGLTGFVIGKTLWPISLISAK